MKLQFSEQLEGFKKWLQSAFAEEPAAGEAAPADSLKEYYTSTGAKVKIDNLEVGGKAYQEDGVTPVTAGFALADGTDVQVDMNGVITAVTAPVTESAPAPSEMTGEQVALQLSEQHKAMISEQFAELKKAQDAQNKSVNEAISKIVALMEQIGDMPSADPVTITPEPTAAQSRKEKAQALINSVKEKKASA